MTGQDSGTAAQDFRCIALEGDGLQTVALVESTGADLGDLGRDGDGLQGIALVECAAVDGPEACRQRNRTQRPTGIKGSFADIRHRVGNGDRGHAVEVMEGVVTDFRHTGLNDDFFHLGNGKAKIIINRTKVSEGDDSVAGNRHRFGAGVVAEFGAFSAKAFFNDRRPRHGRQQAQHQHQRQQQRCDFAFHLQFLSLSVFTRQQDLSRS